MSEDKPLVWTCINLQINARTEGHENAIHCPADPLAWVQSLKQSVKEAESITMHFDTLADGCGGCVITFTHRDETDPKKEGLDAFSFVLSKEGVRRLKTIVDFCADTVD